ncbi:Non-specific lipid-transfer protein-like protein [Apostasia shenzhenica]|uniref:Non-specific lipid-transfer protein-like protein n=1 Tax=Apostasia shenzhenica TaxID=1088818 RepID=A0A2I0BE54_9ASPA|nr:Non-specific lipid-transfer protein-like protein [Apostasia shenzhenica]
MAYETATKIIIAIAMALLAFGLSTTAASGQSGCTTVLIGLAPCLSYMTGNSSSPSSSCCSQLASVVQSQPECLCSALNGGASSLGIAINETRALALPGACNVQTPPVSRCTGDPSLFCLHTIFKKNPLFC